MAPLTRPRLAVLASGGGTTLQNLVDRIADGRLAAEVAVVVATRRDAFVTTRARRHGIPVHVVGGRCAEDTGRFSREVASHVDEAGADLVCMAGFLAYWKIPPAWAGRVMNIHPALLPAFGGKGMYGTRVHEAVLASGVKVSGCTVHFATDEVDRGPVVLQRTVPVAFEDTPDALARRVFAVECEAYPEAIRLFAEDRLRIEGRRVRVLPPAAG